MSKKKLRLEPAEAIDEFASNYFKYLSQLYSNLDTKIFIKFEKEFDDILQKNKTLFILGNGGGASTGSTMVNDLGFDILKKLKPKKHFK